MFIEENKANVSKDQYIGLITVFSKN